jgi:hypothetical protein
MAGAITGALGGASAVPAQWREQVASASRLDITEPGRVLATLAVELHAQDAQRAAARATARDRLAADR